MALAAAACAVLPLMRVCENRFGDARKLAAAACAVPPLMANERAPSGNALAGQESGNAGLADFRGARYGNFVWPHYDDKGRKIWELKGKAASFLGESDDIEVREPQVVLQSSGNEIFFSAPRSVVRTARQLCELEQGVRCFRPDDLELVTEKMLLKMQEKQVLLPVSFSVRKGSMRLKAEQGSFDIDAQRLVCEGPAELLYETL